jgi:hypothetical protein
MANDQASGANLLLRLSNDELVWLNNALNVETLGRGPEFLAPLYEAA